MRVKTVPRHARRREYRGDDKTSTGLFKDQMENRMKNESVELDGCNNLKSVDEEMSKNPKIDKSFTENPAPGTSLLQQDLDQPINLTMTSTTSSSSSDDNDRVIDLSIKSCAKHTTETSSEPNISSCEDEFKDTYLYKIMIDPHFVETICKSKTTKTFPCPFCKQAFSKDEELSDHLDVTKDETNQVSCCACGKTFAQKRYLRYHQRCHSDRSKFSCDICTKRYSRLDNLSRHNNFHMNPDKFPCPSCVRTFARKDLLNKHLKCHENKQRYYCAPCQRYFKGSLSLEKHTKFNHRFD